MSVLRETMKQMRKEFAAGFISDVSTVETMGAMKELAVALGQWILQVENHVKAIEAHVEQLERKVNDLETNKNNPRGPGQAHHKQDD
jgi:hypothetical protein